MQANNNSLPDSRASLHGKIFWKIFTEKAQLLYHPKVYFQTKTCLCPHQRQANFREIQLLYHPKAHFYSSWKSITSNQKGKGGQGIL